MKAPVSLFCLVMLWLPKNAFCQGNAEAVTPEDSALACRLASQASALREENPSMLETSVLLAIEAARRAPTLETNNALRDSVDLLAQPDGIQACENIWRIAVSHNGAYIAVGEIGGTVHLFAVKPAQGTLPPREARRVSEVTSWRLKDPVTALDFSFDDMYLSAGTESGAIEIFNVRSLAEKPASKHVKAVNRLLFAPKSHIFVTASDDNTAKLIDADRGTLLTEVHHTGPVNTVAFNADGSLLATGSDDHLAKLTLVSARQPYGSPLDHGFPINAVCFVGNGEELATAGTGVYLFNVRTGREAGRLLGNATVNAMACSEDGKWLATAGADHTARLFEIAIQKVGAQEVATQQEAFLPLIHANTVNSVAISQDAKWIATGSSDNTARLFELDSGKEVARLPHSSVISSVIFSSQGNYFVTLSGSQFLSDSQSVGGCQSLNDSQSLRSQFRIYPVGNREELMDVDNKSGLSVNAAAMSPDGKLLAVGGDDHVLRVLTIPGNHKKWESPKDEQREFINVVAFSPDGRWVASGDRVATRVFDTTNGRKVNQLSQETTVGAVAFSPDSQTVATVAAYPKAYVSVFPTTIFNSSDRAKYGVPIHAMAFSPDGTLLSTAGAEKSLLFFKVTPGREPKIKPLPMAAMMHGEAVEALAFSRDGRVATGSDDKFARIFPASDPESTAAQEPLLIPHPAKVMLVAFSARGDLLATATEDGTLRIFESSSGKQVAQINDRFKKVKVLQFGENDHALLTVSIERRYTSVRRYLFLQDDLIEQACLYLSRDRRSLTEEEWKRYGGAGTHSLERPGCALNRLRTRADSFFRHTGARQD